jgi:hypothetical protein
MIMRALTRPLQPGYIPIAITFDAEHVLSGMFTWRIMHAWAQMNNLDAHDNDQGAYARVQLTMQALLMPSRTL